MGVIKPPWISQKWFRQCPFNYCDHFGNKQKLAEVCIICKEELEHLEKCKREGKNPYSREETFKVIGENLAKIMVMIQEEARRMGIDLNNLEDDYKEPPPSNKYPIYKLVSKYGDRVEKVINNLSEVPIDTDQELAIKATDAFSHSRHYAIAKIIRALSSRWSEKQDPEDDTEDSRTSALLSYVAIERNSRAALALAEHKPLGDLKQKYLKFAKLSITLCQIIKKQFFPSYRLSYREFGTEEYDRYFDLAFVGASRADI